MNDRQNNEERRTADEPRRSSDILLGTLIDEVKGFREDMKIMREQIQPLNDLSKQIYAAKLAAIWGFGMFAVIGGIITWLINLRDHLRIIEK